MCWVGTDITGKWSNFTRLGCVAVVISLGCRFLQIFVKHLATRQAALSSYTLFSPWLHNNSKRKKNYWWQNVFSFIGYTIVLSCCGVQKLIAVSLFSFWWHLIRIQDIALAICWNNFFFWDWILHNNNKRNSYEDVIFLKKICLVIWNMEFLNISEKDACSCLPELLLQDFMVPLQIWRSE